MSGKRKKRCQHEMIANILEVFDEEAMNKNQIRLATGLGGQQVNALVKEAMSNGLLEWTGEALRTQGENYGQKLRATERGNCWLKLWRLLIRVGDPTSRIRVTIK